MAALGLAGVVKHYSLQVFLMKKLHCVNINSVFVKVTPAKTVEERKFRVNYAFMNDFFILQSFEKIYFKEYNF